MKKILLVLSIALSQNIIASEQMIDDVLKQQIIQEQHYLQHIQEQTKDREDNTCKPPPPPTSPAPRRNTKVEEEGTGGAPCIEN